MFEKINDSELDVRSVKKLSTTPTRKTPFGESGLTAEELKAKFDRMPRYVAERLNEIFEHIPDGKLASALKTGGGKSVGTFIDGLISGSTDINVNTEQGVKSLRMLMSYLLEIYSGIKSGELSDKIMVDEEKTLSEALLEIYEALGDAVGFDKDDFVPDMRILDERENNDRYFNFSKMYPRVYSYHGDTGQNYGRNCLVEAATSPPDPDGVAFGHGEGRYAKLMKSNVIDYSKYTAISELVSSGLLTITSPGNASIEVDSKLGENVLSVDNSGGGQTNIFLKSSSGLLRKYIIETEMYIDLDRFEEFNSDPWFLRMGPADESGNFPAGTKSAKMYLRQNSAGEKLGVFVSSQYTDKMEDGKYVYQALPLKKWFLLRVEQIGNKVTVIVDGIENISFTSPIFNNYGGALIGFRGANLVTGALVKFANTIAISTNETKFTSARLSSIAVRTKYGFVRVPNFGIGDEPYNDVDYADEVAVPLGYVKATQEKILSELDRLIAAQDEILGGGGND